MPVRALLLLALCVGVGCAGTPRQAGRTRPPACRALDLAYARTYGTVLRPPAVRAALRTWAGANVPLDGRERDALSDTARVLLALYESYLDPPARRAELGGEQGPRGEVNRATRYTVVPSILHYAVVRTINPRGFIALDPEANIVRRDSIADFRPRVGQRGERVVYLTLERKAALDCFLRASPFVPEAPMSAETWADGHRRAAFLRGYVPLLHGHWGNTWHYETQPIVGYAEVDAALTEALLYLRLGYEGGYAHYRRTGTEWTLVDHQLTWIE